MRERFVPTIEEIELVGGRLCLDFANTANWQEGAPVDERLKAFADLTAWGRRQGLIDKATEVRLNRQAAADPSAADEMLASAVRLRNAIRHLLSRNDGTASVATLNRALVAPAPTLAEGSKVSLVPPAGDLAAWLLHSVAASAVELLTSRMRGRVKSCPGDRCGWLFLDESPSGRRRWCSMATCGNRYKAKEHYSRRKSRS